MRYIFIILFYLISSYSVWSQYDTLSGKFIHFDNENGLNTNSILSSVQDSKGFIWVSTADGLFRFDGYNFQNVNDLINYEYDFNGSIKLRYLNGFNKIAVSSFKGLYFINDLNLNIEKIDSINIKDIEFSEVSSKLYYTGFDIHQNERNIVGVYDCESETNKIISRNFPENISDISYSSYLDKLILGGDSLYTYSISDSILINLHINKMMNVEDLFVQDIIADSTIYVGSWGYGIIKYKPNEKQLKTYKYSIDGNSVNYNGVRHLNKVNDDLIYVSTADRGIGTFNISSGKFSFYIHDKTDPSSITQISARESMIDRDGNLWASMAESLSLKSDDRNFSKIKEYVKNGYNRDINEYQIGSYRDSIICQCSSNYGKIITYDLQGDVLDIPFKYNFDGDFNCSALATYDGKFYAIDRSKIYLVDFEKLTISLAISSSDLNLDSEVFIFHSIVAGNNALYVKSWNKIYKFIPDGKMLNLIDTIRAPKINQLLFVNKTLYYSDPYNLYKYNGNNDFEIVQPLSDKYFDGDIDPMYLSSSENQYILIGTLEKGFIIYDTNNNMDTIFTTEQGLKTNKISRSASDIYGNIWMLTASGLIMYNKHFHSFATFTERDGIFSTDLLPDYISVINGNILVISVDNGINIIDINKMELDNDVPAIKIYSINGQNPTDNISFDPETITMDIRYSNYTYGDNKDYNFEYKINEEEWREVENKGKLPIIATKPGNYIVSIRGTDTKGRKMEGDSIRFVIEKKWFQTWWFLLLCSLLALGLGGYIYYLINSRKQVAKQIENEYLVLTRELENQLLRSQMNPHFLFNSLNSIRYFILNQESDKAANYLSKFSRLIRLILENSRKEEVLLADEIKMIELYVKLEQVRFENSFDFNLEIDESIDINTTYIPSMLIQPFLENSILHGINPKSSQSLLQLVINKISDNCLRINVIDDGIGRKKSKAIKSNKSLDKKSLGMSITEKRLQMVSRNLNQSIHVTDLYPDNDETGTIISFEINI